MDIDWDEYRRLCDEQPESIVDTTYDQFAEREGRITAVPVIY